MRAIFLSFLNLSVQASFLIVAVLLLRVMLKNSPKWVRYILWGIVALRLLVPFSFESKLSALPNAQKIDSARVSSTSYVMPAPATLPTTATKATVQSYDIMLILSYVWVLGVALMLCYMLLSFYKVHRMVRESVKLRDNIYICDHVDSPFVLGIVNPKIYLNTALSKKESNYIIAHEQTHIRHRDNIWKPLGFFTLCLYWFNPLVWVSYFLFVKDVELFCDESVVKSLSKTGKKKYSTVLLSCSASRATVSACPLAFAENGVKNRVKNILRYKKPALYVVVISVVLCIVTMVCFATSPVSAKQKEIINIAPTKVSTQTATDNAVEPQTEAVTEPQTESQTEKPTESPVQEYYDNSYYNNYSESSYDVIAWSDYYDPYKYVNTYESRNSYSLNTNTYNNFKKNTNPLPDKIYIFEEPRNEIYSPFPDRSGVQRADSRFTGIYY